MLKRLTSWLAGDGAEDLVPSHFGFSVPIPLFVCLFLLAVAAVAVAALYWRRLGGLDTPLRTFLVFTRTATITLLLFLALDPSIVAQRIRPGEQFVILLFDDSQSMRLVGEDGLSRGERLKEAYEAAHQDFEGYLSRRHQLARYRLGVSIEPIQEIAGLDFDQRESDLIGGIATALTDLQGTNISAVVLFSDGVQQSANERVEVGDIPASVPIFTVGADVESNWHDIELSSLSVRRTDFDKSPVVVEVEVQSSGLAGREAQVGVYLGSRLLKSRKIKITEAVETHSVRLEFIPDRPGWLEYEATVELLDTGLLAGGTVDGADRIQENNGRTFIVDNREKEYRILYVSGRPNWENKFVRRALEKDKQLRLTSLISISNAEPKFVFRPGKRSSISNPLFEGFDDDRDRPRYDETVFLRLGASEHELLSGYPATPEELFTFDLLIWGDVKRDFFNTAQFEVTRDFVEKRGGSLLLLGGPNSFSDGGFAGTLIESMLPVVLYPNSEKSRLDRFFLVEPTVEGALSGVWSFEAGLQENLKAWQEMPPLYSLNQFPLVRAGATVMAEAKGVGADGEDRPLYAVQRYGEGKCAILATSDTWQWQMRLEKDDERHERLWRQLSRNLVHEVPEQAVLREKKDAYTQGAPAEFAFILRDEVFDKREGLRTSVTLTSPSQEEMPLSVDESIQETGLYTSDFTPEETGLYRLALTAVDDKDEVVATLDEAFLVEPDRREFQNAQYNAAFLEELSERGGGALYSLANLAELAREIPLPLHQDAEEIRLHLWHLQWFYVILVAMMALEWFLRRRRGHP